MLYPHTIRLRGPWQYQIIARYATRGDGSVAAIAGDDAASGEAALDADWATILGNEFHGRVRLRRLFHRPTNLESHERVWLVVQTPRTVVSVAINDITYTASTDGVYQHECDLTPILQASNTVELVIEASTSQPGPLASTRLEIRRHSTD